MSEQPLNEYIDLETYDVVTGERYRTLQRENAELRLAIKLLQSKVETLSEPKEDWPVPARTADPIPPDTWGD